MANISTTFNRGIFAIKFVNDYSSMPLEAKRKEAEDETETEPWKAKTKRKKFPLKLCKKFINKIKIDEKI